MRVTTSISPPSRWEPLSALLLCDFGAIPFIIGHLLSAISSEIVLRGSSSGSRVIIQGVTRAGHLRRHFVLMNIVKEPHPTRAVCHPKIGGPYFYCHIQHINNTNESDIHKALVHPS